MADLFLGYREGEALTLTTASLQRHFACFGSSGSGKTVLSKVLIEELARNQVPIIAFDPQGDIASLALTESEEKLKPYKLPPEIRQSYADNVEVYIWTPASTRGIPLSLNPFNFKEIEPLNAEEKIRFIGNAAKNVATLIGYDTSKSDGKAVEAALILIFETAIAKKLPLNSFKELIEIMDNLPQELLKSLNKVIDLKVLDTVNQKLSLYTVGTNRLLFDLSRPVSIDDLLGIGSEKTRVSIIYLNTLNSSEEKEFVIATITEMLYQWMLKNPPKDKNKDLQCAYYIDEIAPYIPPVRKPACKESLTVLYKQARKYGVGCIIATQNPGDIDYKSIAQFSTMALGSIYTQQDIKKVRNRLDSLAPKEAEIIASQLSALEKGHFILLAPENKNDVLTMNSRWLVTQHKVLSENDVENITDDAIRQRFLQKSDESDNKELEKGSETESAPAEIKAADDEILIVKLNFYEKDLTKEIKSHLESGLFKNKEKSAGAVLKYLPIIRTHIEFDQKRGFFKNKTETLAENLYLTWKEMKIITFLKGVISVEAIFEKTPDKIEDIDNVAQVEAVSKNELATDIDLKKLKLNEKKVRHTIENKYGVKLVEAEPMLYPYWECDIEHIKEGSHRTVYIDAVTGKTLTPETMAQLK
jgi:hypothetical protein